jgi:fibro-slime domain-containing protein
MSGLDLGIVQSVLGEDDKPRYTNLPRTKSTSGAETFDKWYRKADVNEQAPLALQLLASKENAALFVYDDHAFFPIDGQLLGNETRSHNYHFTLEASTTFQYIGGEVFSFSGDDDMWVFINRQLVIDLGGLHPRMDADVALDTVAVRLGLTLGQVYPLHFFFAERHTEASNFTIRTTIAEPGSCD